MHTCNVKTIETFILKISFGICLFFSFFTPCFANQSIFVTGNEHGKIYMNLESIKISANGIIEADTLIDLTQANRDGLQYFRSIKATAEYDCKTKSSRKILLITFSENMMNGKIVKTTKYNQSFVKPPPNSSGSHIIDFICERVK